MATKLQRKIFDDLSTKLLPSGRTVESLENKEESKITFVGLEIDQLGSWSRGKPQDIGVCCFLIDPPLTEIEEN
tara:strand:- start:1350 stop:1571 length:222 start_codon:yes stop_codon:yes gene_type:complete